MSTKQKGLFYGYPECCIDSFIKIKTYNRTRSQRMIQRSTIYANTGFIPCHECSIKILNNTGTDYTLIQNRICRYPFPKGKLMRRCRINKLCTVKCQNYQS